MKKKKSLSGTEVDFPENKELTRRDVLGKMGKAVYFTPMLVRFPPRDRRGINSISNPPPPPV